MVSLASLAQPQKLIFPYCSGEDEDVEEELETNDQEKNTLSLASEVNSQGNVLFLEDTKSVARSEDEASIEASEHLSFLTSLSLEFPNEKKCHPEARKYLSHFSRHKEELLQRLFALFNRKAFKSALPKDLVFAWNPRLTKTAGVCINRKIRIDNEREERISKIELSSKVIGNTFNFKSLHDSFLNSARAPRFYSTLNFHLILNICLIFLFCCPILI